MSEPTREELLDLLRKVDEAVPTSIRLRWLGTRIDLDVFSEAERIGVLDDIEEALSAIRRARFLRGW